MPDLQSTAVTFIEKDPEADFERLTILFDRSKPTPVKRYLCDRCHYTVFRYSGEVKMEVAGRPGAPAGVIEVQCHNRINRPDGKRGSVFCKKRYYLMF